ncbi:cleft lip and palate transmembrane 1 [Lentinus tigrinus ALCF2SS1-7]|uniref:Cleft lip and palate transmembrane 1 n=1 Tax=Lentinus tigrinus ALCF2SS1-6 TaxID=1328759 RepID=A0A5C2T343_9APHY|nr:cleft lip and palate transmembrane 1 [Lentinus tigrinus ALCF2SS1-6]RPD80680.1 cleft lip and palate transmembrane 1 [Lentinus tigrinus ALCF2SS1-7]
MPTDNAAAQAAPANGGGGGRAEEESPLRRFWGVAQQILLFYAISQVATKFLGFGKQQQPAQQQPAVPAGSVPQAQVPGQEATANAVPTHAVAAWPLGIPLAMHVHLSTSPTGDVFSSKWTSGYRKDNDADLPSLVWRNITFGDWNEKRVADFTVKLPESVLNNGSLWADVFLVRDGASPDPSDSKFDPRAVHHVRTPLTKYLPKTKVRKVKNLLSGSVEETTEEAEEEGEIIVSHWHNNLTLALISDNPAIQLQQVQPATARYIQLTPERDETGRPYYWPIIFPNEFWHLRSQYMELNHTTPTVPLQIEFQPMAYWKFTIFAALTQSFAEAAKQQGGNSASELDEVKRMLVETNPYFLGLTALVSVLHVVFEFLAFSSDVSHWRQKRELVGVSIVTNVVVQIIILLYLIDNNEQTSWMILMGSGIGVVIEAWKITKAVDISLAPSPPGSWLPYMIDIKDKHVLSEDEKKTQEYDKLAFRIVAYFTIPCLAAYTVYSLLYETHRGWYSFVISTLTSFVYMFGFAQLIPQLIINYKLKSVAHMPMKAMVYKTLSTVVDDLFAFCIKMPILHRLACFRDDVVFLVFLYQRWIYRVDPNRVNEYGQVMETDVNAVEGKDTPKTKTKKAESKKNR